MGSHTGIRSDSTELTPVDNPIPSVSEPISLEPGRYGLVSHKGRAPMTSIRRIGNEGAATAHVIKVAVGVDKRVDGIS